MGLTEIRNPKNMRLVISKYILNGNWYLDCGQVYSSGPCIIPESEQSLGRGDNVLSFEIRAIPTPKHGF